MITAAGRPDPATSPITTHSSPVGRVNTSYQSPPTPPLPGRIVQQQHRRGIGLQDVSGAFQQVAIIQTGQRRVGD